MATKPFLPEAHFDIVEGPSKYDLQASAFDGKIIKFSCLCEGKIQKFEARITLIGVEDGSFETWNGSMNLHHPEDVRRIETRTFYYNSKLSKGKVGAAISRMTFIMQ